MSETKLAPISAVAAAAAARAGRRKEELVLAAMRKYQPGVNVSRLAKEYGVNRRTLAR